MPEQPARKFFCYKVPFHEGYGFAIIVTMTECKRHSEACLSYTHPTFEAFANTHQFTPGQDIVDVVFARSWGWDERIVDELKRSCNSCVQLFRYDGGHANCVVGFGFGSPTAKPTKCRKLAMAIAACLTEDTLGWAKFSALEQGFKDFYDEVRCITVGLDNTIVDHALPLPLAVPDAQADANPATNTALLASQARSLLDRIQCGRSRSISARREALGRPRSQISCDRVRQKFLVGNRETRRGQQRLVAWGVCRWPCRAGSSWWGWSWWIS